MNSPRQQLDTRQLDKKNFHIIKHFQHLAGDVQRPKDAVFGTFLIFGSTFSQTHIELSTRQGLKEKKRILSDKLRDFQLLPSTKQKLRGQGVEGTWTSVLQDRIRFSKENCTECSIMGGVAKLQHLLCQLMLGLRSLPSALGFQNSRQWKSSSESQGHKGDLWILKQKPITSSGQTEGAQQLWEET